MSLRYNGANSYLLVNGRETYKFKAKDPEIVTSLLCLGNISKDSTVWKRNLIYLTLKSNLTKQDT